jgi:hypothetical protein
MLSIYSKIISLISPFLPFVCIILAGLCVSIGVSRCSISEELESAQVEIKLKEQEYSSLKAASDLQNQRIESLKKLSEEAAQVYEKSIADANEKNTVLTRTIDSFKKANGSSCEDAMTFIEVLLKE